MSYKDNTFDLVIDKSTLDSFLCGEFSFINVAIVLKEVQRVLKVDGVYLLISYGKPDNRLEHLERDHLLLDINILTIKKEESSGDKEEQVFIFYSRCIMHMFARNFLRLTKYQK